MLLGRKEQKTDEDAGPGAVISLFVRESPIAIFAKATDPKLKELTDLFGSLGGTPAVWNVDTQGNEKTMQEALALMYRSLPLPITIIGQKLVGTVEDVKALHQALKLEIMMKASVAAHEADEAAAATRSEYDCDLLVIGGGSGGIALAKEAKKLYQRVTLLDFVDPSPRGTTWGLGGTCVNVGCIPKKLMHQAALLGQSLSDATKYGWALATSAEGAPEPGPPALAWDAMVEAIRNHISSLNWSYRVEVREKGIQYINGKGSFIDPHTVEVKKKYGDPQRVTAAHICIAVGGRPRYPSIPGAHEFGITSDDLFFLNASPGKTLVVGASYVALECAGFLAGIGLDVTCCVRSILLRGFDQQIAEKIGKYMEGHGVKFIRPAVPLSIEKVGDGPPQLLSVNIKHLDSGEESKETFNTVLFAVGRDPVTEALKLPSAGVSTNAKGFIPVTNEQTNVPHIYAVGDVVEGKPELTPVAIQAGQLLAQRLYNHSQTQMDYINVPTTVFTPLEYGCCGYSEEEAIAKFTMQNLEIYTAFFQPLEWTVPNRDSGTCFCKVICNVTDNNRVIGLHFLGPNAGEVIQGFSAAMKCGMTKEQLDDTVGIHPTVAESLTTVKLLKGTGPDGPAAGC